MAATIDLLFGGLMPSVKVWMEKPFFYRDQEDTFCSKLAESVVAELDCEVDGKAQELKPHEVDVFVIHGFRLRSRYTLILEVSGIDHASRMADIEDRLKNLGQRAKQLMPEGKGKVSVRFQPSQRACWVSV